MQIHKKSKAVLFLVLLLVTVLVFPLAAVSAVTSPVFTALGDSTGYGLSAFPDPANRDITTLEGFNDLFNNYLAGKFGSIDYENIAQPGDKTCDLLAKLQDPIISARVSGSRFLTVSIGGNNLLGPTINAIFGLWGVGPVPGDPDGSKMLALLAAAIAAKYAADSSYDPMTDFARLTDLTQPEAIAFHTALLQGVADFKKQWPAVASRIRSLNRRGELYVTTVHNPLTISSSSDPLYPLYVEFETLIGSINLTIKAYALVYGYRVVDANKVVKNTTGAVTFDIAGAVAAATMMIGQIPDSPMYNYYKLLFLQQTDPHPTYIGHVAIYKQLVSVRKNTPSWYWYLR